MSELPSRDAVAEALTFAPLTDAAADPIYDIARAYVHGGRLVDREAIDYEAGQRESDMGGWLDDFLPIDQIRSIVDAAIRDTK